MSSIAGWCDVLPAVFQQSGVNPGLLVQQLARVPLPPVLPLGFVHFLWNHSEEKVRIGWKTPRPHRFSSHDSPTRPSRPSQLCPSSGGTRHPGPQRVTAHVKHSRTPVVLQETTFVSWHYRSHWGSGLPELNDGHVTDIHTSFTTIIFKGIYSNKLTLLKNGQTNLCSFIPNSIKQCPFGDWPVVSVALRWWKEAEIIVLYRIFTVTEPKKNTQLFDCWSVGILSVLPDSSGTFSA